MSKIELPRVDIYTDGSCDNSKKEIGGYGIVLINVKTGVIKELSGIEKNTTSNRMELLGAICALEALKKDCSVVLHSDSEYLVKRMNENFPQRSEAKGWKRKGKDIPNLDLWKRLLKLSKIYQVEFKWVPGHSGIEMNERCDQLARQAAQKQTEEK